MSKNKIEVVEADEQEEAYFADAHNKLQDMGRRGCKGVIVLGFFDPHEGHEFCSESLDDVSMFEITGFMDLMKLRIQLGHLEGEDE